MAYLGACPAGTVLPFAGPNAPEGWLLCDGSSKNRADYPSLFSALGGVASPYGLPTGSTFSLPDCRGIFIAGVGTQTVGSKSYTKTLGTKQAEATAKNGLSAATSGSDGTHTHGLDNGTLVWRLAGTGAGLNAGGLNNTSNYALGVNNTGSGHGHTITVASTDTETRPANIAMNYIIKI